MIDVNYEAIQTMWGKAREMSEKQTVAPRILVGGKTGVGKSSVLNALLNKNAYETGVVPTTRGNDEEVWTTAAGDLIVVDTPGFAEADADGRFDYADNIRNLVDSQAHIFLLVLKADDRALDVEAKWLEEARKQGFFRSVPSLVVVNQIDKINPVRDWMPEDIDLKCPGTAKEKNIREYLDYVAGLQTFAQFGTDGCIIPIAAGERHDDEGQYGIDALRQKIYELLPAAAKTEFARVAAMHYVEGRRIAKWYAGAAAAAVAANFLPASDALVLAPIQIAMIIQLGRLHGIDITMSSAAGLLGSMGLSFAGRFTAQQLVSFIPIGKNIVGPPLAFGLTYSMALAVNELFATGQTAATEEEWKRLAKDVEEA